MFVKEVSNPPNLPKKLAGTKLHPVYIFLTHSLKDATQQYKLHTYTAKDHVF